MPLFEVAFVRIPPVAEQEQGKSEVLLAAPVHVIANDREMAVGVAISQLREAKAVFTLDACTKALVRPFA